MNVEHETERLSILDLTMFCFSFKNSTTSYPMQAAGHL